MTNPHESKLDGYVEPTEAQIAARKKRNYAIGGLLAAFCIFVFILMIVRINAAGGNVTL